MKAFTQHTGLVAPLDRANVDTDQIMNGVTWMSGSRIRTTPSVR
jgi:3-isopropylmalate dehydratase small subunit